MIAAAMTTRNPRVPLYADLAKTRAVIERDIPASSCERLLGSVTDLQTISAQLRFALDGEGRVCVTGQASAKLRLSCQLCSEPVERCVEAEIDGLLARSEEEARLWQAQDNSLNIVVVSGPELDEVELVEDELLLRLPTQVCVDIDCVHRPAMTYGPLGDAEQVETHRPFAGLAELAENLTTSDAKGGD